MSKRPDNCDDVRERLKIIRDIIINSPQRQKILEQIESCHQGALFSPEPECMCIFGPAGVGKTTIADEYVKGFPVREEKEQRIAPIINITAPSPANVKGLATDFLIALGDPAAEKGSVASQTLRIRALVAKCKVELIILDELQHFGRGKTDDKLSEISNWLKNLINHTNRPVVLMGMPDAEDILEANSQLKRRFQIIQRLEHYKWNNDEGRLSFRKFLNMLDKDLPLPQSSQLGKEDMALRIFCATGGKLGYVVRLLRRAAGHAVMQNLNCLDLDLLASTYTETLATLLPRPNSGNPFLEQANDLDPWLELANAPSSNEPKRGTNRRVKGKPFVPRASLVLKGEAK